MAEHPRRNPGADLIRSAALFCVVAVHFFMYSGFGEQLVEGPVMFAMTLLRTVFLVCVPLFLLLSGYLLGSKEPNRAYYGKLIRTLGIYLLASLACGAYQVLGSRGGVRVQDVLWGILSFSACKYGWYMEMYVGLFLLIPFLNILYRNLDRKQKKLLLVTLMALTALPEVLNIYNFRDISWWLQPSLSQEYQQLIPAWWTRLYPLTYYFLGCYLREFPLGMKKSSLLLWNILVWVAEGSFNFYRSYGSYFQWGLWQENESALVLIQAVLLFSLLASGEYRWIGNRGGKLLAWVSRLSLGAYLVSPIFDTIVYVRLAQWVPQMPQRLFWFLPVVLAVLAGSLALSWVLELVYRTLEYLSKKWISL